MRVSGAQIRLADFQHRLLHAGLVGGAQVARLLGGLFGEPDDRLDHRLERLVARHDGAEHGLFRKLLGLGFDHQHRVGRAGDDEIEHGVLHLLERRIDDDLALDVADARGADRAHERHARQAQRGGSRDHRENVGIGLHVMAQHRDDDLRLAAEIVGEQRPDRTVDQARDQRLLLRRLALALLEAAGYAARGIGLFDVIDGEREEILAGLGRLGGDDGGEHGGLAPAGEHGAVGLAGDAAGLEHELAPAPVQFFALYIKHLCILLLCCEGCESLGTDSLENVIGKTARGSAVRRNPWLSCHDAAFASL